MTNPEVEVATLKERMTNFDRNLQNLDKKVVDGFVEIKGLVKELGTKVDNSNREDGERFITREVHQNSMDKLTQEIDDIKKIATTRSWLMATAGSLIGVVVTVITALLVNYFSK